MAYALMSTITLGFACLKIFVNFDLVNPKHDDIMKILRPYRSKKIGKQARRHPTWTHCGQYHDLEGSRRIRGHHGLTMMVPTICDELCSPISAGFLRSFLRSKRFDGFANMILAIKALFF